MRKINNKKIFLGVIIITFTLGVIFLSQINEDILTESLNISENESLYVNSDKNFKNISFKYDVKDNSNVEFKIFDPNGKVKDSGIISIDEPYNKEFKNINGKWKVEFKVINNKETLIESTITKS